MPEPPGHHTCLKFPDHEKLWPICFLPVCCLGHPPTYVRAVGPGKTLGKTLRTGQEGCFPNLETVSRPNLKRGTSLTATKDAGETWEGLVGESSNHSLKQGPIAQILG